MSISRTVVISCAGMGNRLGIGRTKALVEIEGKTLIRRHLELLDGVEDIRVVVGYQARAVIEEVRRYRSDITFVLNHEYRSTGTGASVCLAGKYANEYLLTLDGDLMIHPEDMKRVLECENEFVGGTVPETEDPWLLTMEGEMVTGFSQREGNYEWTGVSQIRTQKLLPGTGHVYRLLEPCLPLPLLEIRTREIDTIGDYEKALSWVKRGYR